MDAREGSLGTILGRAEPEGPVARTDAMDLQHRPEAVLSVLEADQLFAAKRDARFGRARLSSGARVLLWGLRAYVIAMLLMIAMQVMHTFHGGQ